jgi:eukaryotic-like serine/threonine-protein kinase
MTSLTQNTQLGGRYRLISRIAIGGMGEVWRAEDELLGRHVAVKVLKSEFTTDPTFLERFRTEARMTASLSHAGIASVYDYGEVDVNAPNAPPTKTAYLVMELVEGEPLSAILARDGRLPTDRTLDVVEQAATALEAAHKAGMVHRDVKPGNLLVGQDGVIKITDFGIARVADTVPLTQSGMVVGTAQYFSPEQAEGRSVNAASDVYSLGVVAYECLAGRLPFVADSPVTVAIMQIRDVPPPLPADVPPAVHQLVARAMAKDARQRFATGGQLAMAVRAVRNGQLGPFGPVPSLGHHSTGPHPMPVVPAPAMPGPHGSVAAQVAAGLAAPPGAIPPQGPPPQSVPQPGAPMSAPGAPLGPPMSAPHGAPPQGPPMSAPQGAQSQAPPMSAPQGAPSQGPPMSAPQGAQSQAPPMSAPQGAPSQGPPMSAPQGASPALGGAPHGAPSQGPPMSAPQQAPSQGVPFDAAQHAPSHGPSHGAPRGAQSQGSMSASQAAPSQGQPMGSPMTGPPEPAPGQLMQPSGPGSMPMHASPPSMGGTDQSMGRQTGWGPGQPVHGGPQTGQGIQSGSIHGPLPMMPGAPTGPPTGAVPRPQGYRTGSGRGRTILVVLLCLLGIALLTIGAILLIHQQNQDRNDPAPPARTAVTGPANSGKPADPAPGQHDPTSGPAPGPAGLRHTAADVPVFGAARARQNDNNMRTQ